MKTKKQQIKKYGFVNFTCFVVVYKKNNQ